MNRLCILVLIFGLSCSCCFAQTSTLLKDELVDTTLKEKVFENPYKPYKYNYSDTKRIPIELSIIGDIVSEKDVCEGQDVVFVARNDVYQHGQKILRKGDRVHAKVETIIKSGMNGIPASIIFSDFKFDNIERTKLSDTYEEYGLDRSGWVFPLKWALTPLPPTGSLTNFIKGGHAKLTTDEVIEIYYHPNW